MSPELVFSTTMGCAVAYFIGYFFGKQDKDDEPSVDELMDLENEKLSDLLESKHKINN